MRENLKEMLFKIADWFDDKKAFQAIRQGLVMMMPVIVIGSMALMLKSLPVPAYQKLLPELFDGKIVELLEFIYYGVFRFFAVILAVTTSFSYAMTRQKEKHTGFGDVIIPVVITLAVVAGSSGIQSDDFKIAYLGNTSTFSALFLSLLSSWLFFLIKEKQIFQTKKKHVEADNIYGEAVSGILPALLVVFLFAVFFQMFRMVFHVNNIQELMELIINRFFNHMGNGLGAGIVVILLTHGMWFLGIHGNNVLENVMQQNYLAIESETVYSKTFQDVFVIMGGSGTILCLVVAILLFSRKKSMKNVASLAFPTVIFNISEIIAFGLPVILNPIFLIPFMLVPIVCCLVSYGAIYMGIVPHVVQEVEWTTPIFLSGYEATGSIAGSILQLVCLVLGVLIYLPFIRLFEEQSERHLIKNVKCLVAELQQEEESNRISGFTERNDAMGSVARLLAADLEEALKNRELFLMYQPQVNGKEVCIGAEALIRWMHPVAGFIYPPLIIQLAKEKKILSDLETFLFDEAAYAISEIGKSIQSDFKLSVNITNESLAWKDFEKCIDDSVKKHQIPRERLWFEITEQDALVSTIEVMNKLQSLKDKGHKLLIDDFGMGHTSLMYLQTNHFEIVKLDGSLTRNLLENERNTDIIASIVYLGSSLNFTTLAEYVETREQRDKLAQLGVDVFQGYLYSKPVKLEELIPWMEAHQ